MSDLPKLELSPFESNAMERKLPHYSRQKPFPHDSSVQWFNSKRKSEDKTSSLLTKLGISAAVCALLLTVMFSDIPLIDRIAGGIQSVLQEEVSPDDALGRLKFVQNGIADVFTSRPSYAMPIAQAEVTKESEEGDLIMTGIAQCDVFAFDAGTVAETGLDDKRGGYVVINHNLNMVSTYYGLASVLVEKNQPLHKGDAIGRTGMDGTIKLSVNEDGVARDAMELLGLKQN